MKKMLGCLLLAAALGPLASLAGPVNINTADAEAISRELKGVGMKKAQAIVDYRVRNGEFQSPEDLLNVKGIGSAVLEDNRGNIQIAD